MDFNGHDRVRMPMELFEYAPVKNADVTVVVPNGIQTKELLFATFESGLHFPDYFGYNWDAFEECFRDLTWLLPRTNIVVEHLDVPMLTDVDRAIYIDILHGAVQKSKVSNIMRLHVTFPHECKDTVESIVKRRLH